MLNLSVAISSEHTTNVWWQRVRPRLVILYVIIVLTLLIISAIGHIRLLSEVGHAFGGFFWSIDSDGQVLIVSTPPQLPPFVISDSLTSTDHIIGVNAEGTSRQSPAVAACVNQQKNVPVSTTLTCIYEHVNPGDTITYTIQHNDTMLLPLKRPAATFTWDMWWQSYGLTLLAGISWLLVGTILLATARDWIGAVEGITLLPPAMLFLLYSHWGNVQQAYPEDIVFQLLWVPSFALLGAAFIHLSLTYRPDAMSTTRTPRLTVDGLPYLPLIGLVAFEWSSYLIKGDVPTRLHFLFALGYGVFG